MWMDRRRWDSLTPDRWLTCVLVLHVSRYRARYEDVSVEESLDMLRTEKNSDEQAKTLADGFGVLVQALKALA